MTVSIASTRHAIAEPYRVGQQPKAAAVPEDGRDRELSALMRSAQDGDRAAYELLLREILPLLKRVVQGRLGFLPAADRDDLVQDILLSLHAARATYDPARPFLPWLMAIAHNRTVDQVRRNSRRHANELSVDEYPANIADDDAGRFADGFGDPQELRRAIKDLPKGQRSAIELLKLRELSLKEASRETGLSETALKVSVHRAIKALRAVLHA
jgi:RNA polymerase sigma-70 factor (ECF subfamily)